LTFQSAQTGQSIGFAGNLQEGVDLVVGDPDIVKAWNILLAGIGLKFKIILSGSKFVMTLPGDNPEPGTPVSLSEDAGKANQVWIFTISSD